jgi:hypothetical protein
LVKVTLSNQGAMVIFNQFRLTVSQGLSRWLRLASTNAMNHRAKR